MVVKGGVESRKLQVPHRIPAAALCRLAEHLACMSQRKTILLIEAEDKMGGHGWR